MQRIKQVQKRPKGQGLVTSCEGEGGREEMPDRGTCRWGALEPRGVGWEGVTAKREPGTRQWKEQGLWNSHNQLWH